jgi:hypothetical protein
VFELSGYEKGFLLVCGTYFFCVVAFQDAFSQGSAPISINASLDRRSIYENDKVIVTVNVANKGNLLVKGLDIQIVSSGLKLSSQKNWPENFFPNSSLVGQYILETSGTGTFPVSLSSTYTVNNTSSRPPTVKQFGSTEKIAEVYVAPNSFLSWSSAWEGAPTTILGTIIGFVITKVTDYWTSRRIEERDRAGKTALAKSYVLHWLEINEKLVEKHQPPRFADPWQGIENVYDYIPDSLRDEIRNLYIDLRDYSDSPNKGVEAPSLCTKISNAIQNTKGWIT